MRKNEEKPISYTLARRICEYTQTVAEKMGLAMDPYTEIREPVQALQRAHDLLRAITSLLLTNSPGLSNSPSIEAPMSELQPEPLPEPSKEAFEVMKSRDWLLNMRMSDVPVEPSVLDDLNRQLEQIIEAYPHYETPEQEKLQAGRNKVRIDLPYVHRFIQPFCEGDKLVDARVIHDIDHLLEIVLINEGIASLELATGRYDAHLQQVQDKQLTDNQGFTVF
jgi:hypothetical protein